MQKTKFLLRILIILVAIGMTTCGWLTGHIVRYSIPALQHPPIHFPGEKIGELSPPQAPESKPFVKSNINPMQNCLTNVYYTSFPAKCHTPDGKLVLAGNSTQEFLVIFGEGQLEK